MPNKSNISTGKPKVAGAVFSAPAGSNLPADAKAELDEAFVDLGYLNEEGLSNKNSPEKKVFKEWGGSVVTTLQTERNDIFSFTLIESSSADVLKRIYGSENVTISEAEEISIVANNSETESFAWVFDMVLKSSKIKRIVVPSASVTELGDIKYVANDLISYKVEITAELDASGNTHYEYIS